MGISKLYLGDCRDILKTLPENSVDSICCDPPYELGFMGKEWDNTGIANNVEMWKECLRVLKPGGHLLAFSGTRTYHRMASAIEDAGFEVRDMIEWVYGSGFPKSLNIGVAVNKLETKEWSAIGKALDNIDQKSIIGVWKSNSKNVKIVETQLLKLQEKAGCNTPSENFVRENVAESINQIKLSLNVNTAEKYFIVLQAINIEEDIVRQNVEKIITEINELQNPATIAENLQQKDLAMQSMNIFTAQCNVKEWLSENTEVNHKVDEALKTLRGNKKYSNEEITNVLCVALTDILKLTILNQSKTFQNLGTNQKMECVSAINVIITEYTAENLISNTVAILKSKAVDKLQGNERKTVREYETHDIRNAGLMDKKGAMTVSETKGTSEWEGWGTAIKPSHEPIAFCRKPLEKGLTVAENCLKWGTGGINIEQSRVLTPDDEARKQKILAGEVVCNAFCDKHGLYPSSLDDILSFSQQQLLDFYQHIFSELGSYSISYTNLLHNLDGLDYKSCKRLLGVPYDCGRLSERVNEYVYGRQQYQGSQSDCPTLSRLYGECVRWNLDVSPNVFPLNDDVQSDILHYLSSKENNLLDNNPHLVFVLVCLAYSLLVNNNLHNHYTTCKNKMQVGRFPSNLLHDNSEEVRECFPETKQPSFRNGDRVSNNNGLVPWNKGRETGREVKGAGFTDTGNASRFFKSIIYTAKASKKERNMGCEGLEEKETEYKGFGLPDLRMEKLQNRIPNSNNHPTVKPIALMEYLIKMVTRKGGIVLDPFMGSGSTGVACKKNGFNFIGIDKEEEYIKIAEARINYKQ